jgi:hypothetical protein
MKDTVCVTWMPASIMKQRFSHFSRTTYSAGTLECAHVLPAPLLMLQHCNKSCCVAHLTPHPSLLQCCVAMCIYVLIAKESITIYMMVITATINAIL